METKKYNRTFHLPWSKGATKDDRIAKDVSYLLNKQIIITEKLDGSNVSLETSGCYARSHAGPPNHISFDTLKAIHAQVKFLLKEDTQYFGEYCYAKHSIHYNSLPAYLMLFGIRDLKTNEWASFDDVVQASLYLNIPTVPVLFEGQVNSKKELESLTNKLASEKSACGGEREGIVVRLKNKFNDIDFDKSIAKFVRANHVVSSEHWKHEQLIKNNLKATYD